MFNSKPDLTSVHQALDRLSEDLANQNFAIGNLTDRLLVDKDSIANKLTIVEYKLNSLPPDRSAEIAELVSAQKRQSKIVNIIIASIVAIIVPNIWQTFTHIPESKAAVTNGK
jgi:hypothetical protein